MLLPDRMFLLEISLILKILTIKDIEQFLIFKIILKTLKLNGIHDK